MEGPDKKSITVTMDMEQYERLSEAARGRDFYLRLLERANRGGRAVMTDELREAIEGILD